MYPEDARKLLNKYAAGNCNDHEIALIHSWYNKLVEELPFPDDQEIDEETDGSDWNVILAKHHKRQDAKKRRAVYRVLSTTAVAAAVLVGIILSIIHRSPDKKLHKPSIVAKNIQPGRFKGILRLSNGKEIDLQKVPEEHVEEIDGLSIRKINNQIICRLIPGRKQVSSPGMNTLIVPNGGKYSIELQDGSYIQLNAGSEFSFPSAFENTRHVALSGEGFFDIKKNEKQPFEVTSNNQTLTVLGTRFNVSSYGGEAVVTTLVKGKVVVHNVSTGNDQLMKPTDQLSLNGSQASMQTADTITAIAWKEDLFMFKHTPLREALKQIGRWYDVDVDTTNIDGGKPIMGVFSRGNQLTEVIGILNSAAGIQLKLEGHTIKRN